MRIASVPVGSPTSPGLRADVTVAICAHNAAARLRRALEPLARQRTGVAWELLVIDNASTDGTGAAASSIAAELGVPCRVLQEPRVGLVNARRLAAAEATGRILSYVDDDNVVNAFWIEECVAFFRRHPGAGVVGGRIDPEFEVPGSEPPDFAARFAHALAIRDFGPEPRRLRPPEDDPPCGAGMTGPTAVFRAVTSALQPRLTDRCGARLSSGGDTELGLLAHRLGYELWYEPRLTMRHVLPPGRLTQGYLDRLIVGGSTATAWLEYLRGKEPRRGRLGYAARAARHAGLGAYLAALGRLRKQGHRDSDRYPVWAGIHFGTARGYWDLCRRYPMKELDRALAGAREAAGAADGAPADRREAVLTSP